MYYLVPVFLRLSTQTFQSTTSQCNMLMGQRLLDNTLLESTCGLVVWRVTSQWANQASLLTLQKTRHDHPNTQSNAASMASTKRKVVDGEPDGNENAKKLKQDGDVAVSTTLQSDLGMIQGPDDTAITELFNTLVWLINTFTGQYFQGAPYADARKKDQKAYFQSLVGSDYKKYLKSEDPGVKQAIIEAAIWNMLIDPLLRTPTKAFIDEMPELKVRASTSGKLHPA